MSAGREDAAMETIDLTPDSPLGMILRLLMSCLLGGALGIQREITRHPAGLRTHMLVALSSTGLVLVGLMLLENVGENANAELARIIQGIVTGVGFIGAGAIMREGFNVYGITTAASLWVACALGIMVGIDAFLLAALTAVIATILLLLPHRDENRRRGEVDQPKDPK